MSQIKTAISIDEVIFKEANLLAKKAHVSRSHLFEMAVAELVKKEKDKAITEQISKALRKHPPTAEEKRYQRAMHRSYGKRIKGDEW